VTVAGAVLAAGAGRRFGDAPKQLADVGGLPLLQHAIDAQAAGGLDRRAVVVGARADEVLAAVDVRGADVVRAADWDEGLAASLRAAVAWADDVALEGDQDPEVRPRWLLITLGDQPRVGAAAVAAVAQAARAAAPGTDVVRATYAGEGGHPVALRRTTFDQLRALRGDTGARDLLAGARPVELGALADPADVDTPADLEALTP